MRFHVCLYLGDDEVLNINDVEVIERFDDCICITSCNRETIFDFSDFDKIVLDQIKIEE